MIYDYGRENSAVYGQRKPPLYDLTKVTAPTFVHHSSDDDIVTDILEMQSVLPNLLGINVVHENGFLRADFIYSGREIVYEKVH